MKVAIPAEDKKGMEGIVYQKFGRSPFFLVVEIDEQGNVLNSKVIDNPGGSSMHGAGPFAARTLNDEGVQTLIAANVGPNASNALRSFNIKIYQASAGTPVKEAIRKLLNGELSLL